MQRCRLARSAALATVIVAAAGCDAGEEPVAEFGAVETLPTPAAPGSSAPNLALGPDGRVYLSWIESAGESVHALRFATLEGEVWSTPRTVATGSGWFVNWADFPAMAVLGDGRLAAHYLQRPDAGGGGAYSYHVRLVQSGDGGESWSEPVTPHADRALAEHGFVSLFPGRGDSVGVVWLDGRSFTSEYGGNEEMSLRSVFVAADGGLGQERVIDGRTCECCQTSVALTGDGPVVAYRDRAEGEIRDIHVSRMVGGGWSAGSAVRRDGWEMNACPVNGPSIASDGASGVAVAWFTGAADSARVYVGFSANRGDSFGEAIRVDEGAPIGRVDVAMLADGGALVSWLESGDGEGARVMLRRVSADGGISPPLVVTAASDARSSGFPQMAVAGEEVVLAWTDPGDPSQVRTARTRLGPPGR